MWLPLIVLIPALLGILTAELMIKSALYEPEDWDD
jgi:hypothetical protein